MPPPGAPEGSGRAYATPSSAPAAQKPRKVQARLLEGGLKRALATFTPGAGSNFIEDDEIRQELFIKGGYPGYTQWPHRPHCQPTTGYSQTIRAWLGAGSDDPIPV